MFSKTLALASRTTLALTISALASACVTSPVDGASISSRGTSFGVDGYASAPGAEISIQCRNPTGGSWVEIGDDLASNNASNAGQSHLLYGFYDQVTVPSQCWTANGEFGWRTHLRVREPNAQDLEQLKTFTQQGMGCLGTELSGSEWVQAGATCSTGNTIVLYAIS